MEQTKRIHNGWLENEKIKAVGVEPIFEKWQHIYSEGDVGISLVQFTPRMYGKLCWEIYQLKGKNQLLEDVERFATKEEAELRIKMLFRGINNA